MIKATNLQFSYGKSPVFEGFSLELSSPGIHGLFGRNGSGKSTLLKILSGLLFPHDGNVSVLGYKPEKRLPAFLEQVYILPEEFHLPDITIKTLQKTHALFYPAFSSTHFQSYIDTFEVPTSKGFASMSLGQKKKAVMAFALATHTPILLMDEPTNGLDILGRSQFKKIMGGDEHKHRIVLISTHQAHDLETLMNHVLFVDGGKLALSASMQTLQSALYMGVTDNQESILTSIYREALGNQYAFVTRNTDHVPAAVNLELLYKALSMNKPAVLDAITAYEVQMRTTQ